MGTTTAGNLLPSSGLYRTKDDVLAHLERRIVDGGFGVGDQLPSERLLGAQYNVSRPVIREVLRGLSERGYIEVYPGRGSFVRAVAADDLAEPLARFARRAGVTPRHLVSARTMLECTAAELAARNVDERAVESLRAALTEHVHASDLQARARSDLSFHEAVARAAGNPVITVMFGSIRNLVYGLMLRSLSDREVTRAGDPWHGTIFDCIAAHDAEGARSAMAEHLRLALDFFGDDLDTPLADVLARRGIESSHPNDASRGPSLAYFSTSPEEAGMPIA